jgi:hypothetical protein
MPGRSPCHQFSGCTITKGERINFKSQPLPGEKPKSGKQVLMLPGLTDWASVAENPLRLCVFA